MKLLINHIKQGIQLNRYYRYNNIQYHLYFLSIHIFGKYFTKKNELHKFIMVDKENNKKLHFNNIYFVYEQINNEYDVKLKPDMNIVDIGACCGEFTTKALKNGCKVLAIECNKDNFDLLYLNTKFNDDVLIINKKINNTNNRLDDFIHFDTIDILKIDVDRDEINVLLGANRTLIKSEKVIVEYHTEELRRQCLKILSNYFSNVVIIEDKKNKQIGKLYLS